MYIRFTVMYLCHPYVIHIFQLILFHNAVINIELFMSSSLMCVFPCWLLQLYHCYVLQYSLLFCVVTISTMHYCVISVTEIVSYKILLCVWYVAYHSYMYVAIGSIKMHLSINNISSCSSEYRIALKVCVVLDLTRSISMHKRIINPYIKPTDTRIWN
jgi:hypothetical protein